MAIVIEAPNEFKNIDKPKVFLAGSIEMGKSRDWQVEVTEELDDFDVVFLNPRRRDWDFDWIQSIDNPQFREQVEWELDAQEDAELIIMHFEVEAKAPISLLELGLFARSGKLLVHCPEGFWRKGNVDIVCNRYEIFYTDNWDKFLKEIKNILEE